MFVLLHRGQILQEPRVSLMPKFPRPACWARGLGGGSLPPPAGSIRPVPPLGKQVVPWGFPSLSLQLTNRSRSSLHCVIIPFYRWGSWGF